MDLLERIKQVNKQSEENNRKSAQAQAQQRLLTEQISEKVAEYEQEFGISFPNIEDGEKFSKFLDRLVRTTEDELLKQVEVAEKVNQLILDGDIEGAQELLGYDFEASHVDGTEDEDIEEVVEEVEELEDESTEDEVEYDDIADADDENEISADVDDEDDEVEEEPQEKETPSPIRRRPRRTVVSNDLDLDDLEDEEPVAKPTKRRKVVEDDDLEDEEPVAKPKRTRTRRAVVTSNFDMDGEDSSVSLEELNKVAQISPKGNPLEDVEEEEVPTVRRRRRKMVAVPDEEEVDDYVAPTRPVRSGGSFKFD